MAYTISDVAERKLVNGELVKLTEEERQAVLLRWNAPDTRAYDQKRQEEYPSIDELTVALWEGVVEERMQAVTQLEIKRQAVKAKYPK